MTETIEMRLRDGPSETPLEEYFTSSEIVGRRGALNVLVARVKTDPRGERLKALVDLKDLLLGWQVKRQYSKAELEKAELFRLVFNPGAVFEGGAADECYDTSLMCPECGAGRVQKSDLVFETNRLPKRSGVVRTLSDEILLTDRAAHILLEQKLTGFQLRPIIHRLVLRKTFRSTPPSWPDLYARASVVGIEPKSAAFYLWLSEIGRQEDSLNTVQGEDTPRAEDRAGPPTRVFYQIVSVGQPVSLSSATQFGYNPLTNDIEGTAPCSFGHTLGWEILSETFVRKSSWAGLDFCISSQLYGKHAIRGSLFYPRPVFLVSRRLMSALKEESVSGITYEIAHLIDS